MRSFGLGEGVAALAAAAVLASLSLAQASAQPAAASAAAAQPKAFVTEHVGTFGGRRVAYTATAGETTLKDAKGAPAAPLVAYPLWCGFATLLSGHIWLLNRSRPGKESM